MTEMTDWENDISGEENPDEGIIELTDIVEEGSFDSTPDEIIELTDIVEDLNTDLDLDIVREDSLEIQENTGPENGGFFEAEAFDHDLELEIDQTNPEPSSDPVDASDTETALGLAGNVDVSPELFEAALEKVIEKRFADKIDSILFKVMEKVIEKEIVEIKASLQKDLDQIGTN